MYEIIDFEQSKIQQLIAIVEDALTSKHSKRAYRQALTDFFSWYNALPADERRLNKATVQRYRQTLAGAPSSINLKMSAVRKLTQEAADNGWIDPIVANGVQNVKGVKVHGVRSGQWLTKKQAQKMLLAPDVTTLKGIRDRALLAVMIGAGLRRSEVTALTVEHIQQRDSRWVIIDLVGKGQHIRTVPIANWVKTAIDEWTEAAGIVSGVLFRAINRHDVMWREAISPQGVSDVVAFYGDQIGVPDLNAHDLRRTFAKLARTGGSDIQQIQFSLGHLSTKTTERYLGTDQDLSNAPCDHLGLSIG